MAKKYATKEANISGFQTLYSMAQCTEDLSAQDCRVCLVEAIGQLPKCCDGKQGGRVVFPSCNVRYELYPFYRSTASASSPSPSPPGLVPSTNSSGRSSRISSGTIVAIAVPITAVMLLSLACVSFLSKRARKKHDSAQGHQILLGETEFDPVDSLRYDFSTIEAATNNFSEADILGEGGFGKMYKGLLPNGQEIAVKRLSKSLRQGAEEIKNDAKLVAKLRYRHLVRLLGFCLQGEEKILVYEFLPNKSLDYILFDPVKQCILDWTRRYNIIRGVVRDIQYMHEDSELKIVHRDLKTSNILLDRDMNPKISDFGIARIFGVDESQGTTSRIVGTNKVSMSSQVGYICTEYAMGGKFSTKSDIFSFGVLLLEIISGKKNNSFYQTGIAEDLLSYAWKLWEDGASLDLMDLTIRESCTADEVMRCIQIGLLSVQEHPADRPTVTKIVNMLHSHSTLPVPNQPAFFIRSTNPMPKSVNEMPISEVDPR